MRQHEYLYYTSRPIRAFPTRNTTAGWTNSKRFEVEHPELITPDSPTQRVGGTPRKGFETRQHRPPMLSLDNAFSYEELDAFDRRVRELTGREHISNTSPSTNSTA